MHIYLRELTPQAVNNFRVIAIIDSEPIEVGSICLKTFTSDDVTWTWGIDTVIPMRATESKGRGNNRHDCLLKFRSAWDRFASDPERLSVFLYAKKRSRQG